MKKLILAVSFLLLNGVVAISQTTATNFTAPDCSSNSHTLFTELDAGKVVVLVWIMPCGACISDSKGGYDAAHSFAASDPGRVLYWLCDDQGNTSCSALADWAGANGISPLNVTMFDNSGNAIDEANYGGSSMPHVVVIGGSDHHIYYNQKNGSNDGAAITTAISQALAGTPSSISPVPNTNDEITLFPDPAKNMISLSYTIGAANYVSVEVFNAMGARVRSLAVGNQCSGRHALDVNFDNVPARGIYFVKINIGALSYVRKFSLTD